VVVELALGVDEGEMGVKSPLLVACWLLVPTDGCDVTALSGAEAELDVGLVPEPEQ